MESEGVSLKAMADLAETLKFRTTGMRCSYEVLEEGGKFPYLAYWEHRYFVVVYGVKNGQVYVGDPDKGFVTYTVEAFKAGWEQQKAGESVGMALMLTPTPDFYKDEFDRTDENRGLALRVLLKYLPPYRRLILQVFLSLLTGSILALFIPFLTQMLVDQGVNKQDLNIIYVVLIAQLMMFVGQSALDGIRSWILLHVASRVTIVLFSDFIAKLMKLPVAYFDSKNTGDLLQRLKDNRRVKKFLTSSSLSFIFSLLNIFVFGGVLLWYSWEMFLLFSVGSGVYIAWVMYFMQKRWLLDAQRFEEQSSITAQEIQMVRSMQEIKLNNYEREQRWAWERLQVKLFNVELGNLSVQQYQRIGGGFLNELKNILITFWAAKEVVDGQMTLGMMMAAQQILGQLNAPLLQFITFAQQAQDAEMSLDRVKAVYELEEEDEADHSEVGLVPPKDGDLILEDVYFKYSKNQENWILKNINLRIPKGQTVAIVGSSGSGKSTLLKLLLKFYQPEKGNILMGDTPLRQVNNREWREKVGTVLQNGSLFSESIAQNIVMGDEQINLKRLTWACDIANIREYIESLPRNYSTKVGHDGIPMSQGQLQRLLIARAIYKNPSYLFFDEATSALDSKNERQITDNIELATHNKTVIIVAHRLSTVRNADKVVVLEKGEIKEEGTHEELVEIRGLYYELIKNQLELGD